MNCPPVACAFALVAYLACSLPAAGVAAVAPPVGTLAPQGPGNQPAGILMGSPIGITCKEDPAIRVTTAGFTPGAPPNWPPGLPQPHFDRLVDQLTPSTLSRPLPLLAMSLGIDVLAVAAVKPDTNEFPAEPPPLPAGSVYPVLAVGAHGWYAIEFSVDTAQLEPNADLAPEIAAARDETDRSVFGYVLPESASVLLPMEAESVRILTPAALDLDGSTSDEIDALNMHMGLYWTDLSQYQDMFATRPLPEDPAVYFTLDVDRLTEADRQALATAWHLDLISSQVIYRTQWQSGWQDPTIYRTAAALKITVPAGVAIDGLALDTKGTSRDDDDELLYSLRGTSTFAVPPAAQMMHVATATTDPRPILLRRGRGDGYGTLGRQMRGGQGIGDFCTADPWALSDRQVSVWSATPLLDDFLVARRLPPDGPYTVRSRRPDGLSLSTWIGPDPLPELPFGCIVVSSPYDLPDERDRPIVLLPADGQRLQLPEMALAIAGFRVVGRHGPTMRACMSWPDPMATDGEVTVRWGWLLDYTRPVTDPGNVAWENSIDQRYHGQPFVRDCPLRDDGALPPRRLPAGAGSGVPVGASTPPPLPQPGSRKACVMQWKLRVAGRTYISPIAALRY